jgi:hypothetical protein
VSIWEHDIGLSLQWVILNQSTSSHPVYLRSIFILSSHLRLGLPGGLFPSDCPTTILYAFLISYACYMSRPFHSPWFDHLNNIYGEAYKLWSSSLCSLLQPPATSSLLGPHRLLSTLSLDSVNLCSSPSVRDQVPYPYKTSVACVHITWPRWSGWTLKRLAAKQRCADMKRTLNR